MGGEIFFGTTQFSVKGTFIEYIFLPKQEIQLWLRCIITLSDVVRLPSKVSPLGLTAFCFRHTCEAVSYIS